MLWQDTDKFENPQLLPGLLKNNEETDNEQKEEGDEEEETDNEQKRGGR